MSAFADKVTAPGDTVFLTVTPAVVSGYDFQCEGGRNSTEGNLSKSGELISRESSPREQEKVGVDGPQGSTSGRRAVPG